MRSRRERGIRKACPDAAYRDSIAETLREGVEVRGPGNRLQGLGVGGYSTLMLPFLMIVAKRALSPLR